MPLLVHFGAGNIGRSLVAPLFRAAGYDVICVDANPEIVDALNSRPSYRVVIKDTLPPGTPDTIVVAGVRAIHASDTDAVARTLSKADLCSTAVGAAALPHLAPPLAAGLRLRSAPLNIILCENLRHAASLMRSLLRPLLPPDLLTLVGLVETSIGKMVPLMPAHLRAADPLEVWAEAYNEIIADAAAFLGSPPSVPGLVLKHNFPAYVDRKLFIHNLGHAAAAYHGFLAGARFIWEALDNPSVFPRVTAAMHAAAAALALHYPDELSRQSLTEYINDLLRRFKNRALADTVFRVGRDLPRKLAPDDRCIGALRLVCAHHGDPTPICAVIAAALHFAATDENGRPFPADLAFLQELHSHGLYHTLARTSGLHPLYDAHLLALIDSLYRAIR